MVRRKNGSNSKGNTKNGEQCAPSTAKQGEYCEALGAWFEDTKDLKELRDLAESLSWTLAQIAVEGGVDAIGDILATFGDHVRVCTHWEELKRQKEGSITFGH